MLQPTGTGPDINRGHGPVGHRRQLRRPARAVRRPRQRRSRMAAYGAFGAADGPRGLFGAFPGNPTELESGGGLLFPPSRRAAAARSSTATRATPTCRAPRWPRRWSPATAALVRDAQPRPRRRPRSSGCSRRRRARPAGSGWEPELGWGILDAGAALRRRARGRPPPARRRRLHGARACGLDRGVDLRWSADDPAPAGLHASAESRASRSGAPSTAGRYKRKLRTTRSRALTVRAPARLALRFYTVAVDRAGNREAPPQRAPDAARHRSPAGRSALTGSRRAAARWRASATARPATPRSPSASASRSGSAS